MSTSFPPDAAHNLAELAAQVADGKVRVVITDDLPLADAAKAMQLNESGHGHGKIVLHR